MPVIPANDRFFWYFCLWYLRQSIFRSVLNEWCKQTGSLTDFMIVNITSCLFVSICSFAFPAFVCSFLTVFSCSFVFQAFLSVYSAFPAFSVPFTSRVFLSVHSGFLSLIWLSGFSVYFTVRVFPSVYPVFLVFLFIKYLGFSYLDFLSFWFFIRSLCTSDFHLFFCLSFQHFIFPAFYPSSITCISR